MQYITYKSDEFLPLSEVTLLGLEKSSVHQNTYFTPEEAKRKIDEIHDLGKRAVIWVNRFLFEPELDKIIEELVSLDEADGFMLMDFGLMKRLRERGLKQEIIAQTDTTLTNYRDAQFLLNRGFDKVVAARELAWEEILEMGHVLKDKMIFHSFGHQRVSSSRRPLLTAYGQHIGKDLKEQHVYALREQSREYRFQVLQEESGTHIFDEQIYWAMEEAILLREIGVKDVLIETLNIDDNLLCDLLLGESLDACQAKYPHVSFTRALLDVKTTEKKVDDE